MLMKLTAFANNDQTNFVNFHTVQAILMNQARTINISKFFEVNFEFYC